MINALFDVDYVKPSRLSVTSRGLSEMEQIMMTLVWTIFVLINLNY
jgi:hypothetical protein